jgi:hypothetical protein
MKMANYGEACSLYICNKEKKSEQQLMLQANRNALLVGQVFTCSGHEGLTTLWTVELGDPKGSEQCDASIVELGK